MSDEFRDLLAWKRGMMLVKEVYALTETFPEAGQGGLAGELRRSAVAVPSRVASGEGRMTDDEFVDCLSEARGAALEAATQLTLAEELGYATEDGTKDIHGLIDDVVGLIDALADSLGSRN